ncbi:MAG: hypothetical protein RLZZ200_614 [Pseudomonadota bacterium]|jgi:transcriptional regulator with XRE-family HTH domain
MAEEENPVPETQAAPVRKTRSQVDTQRSVFLRKCRARIRPEDVGLPQPQRTRSAGLRREDVAALAGVSASWYTWLEQGRDMRVSDELLERLCRTLRLSEDERIYLFTLVQHRPPRIHSSDRGDVPPDVLRLLDSVGVPAIVLNLRCDVLAWNPLNSAIYRDYGSFPPEERNLLEILLAHPARYATEQQHEATIERLVARLRYDYSKCSDDPKFDRLVHRLCAKSPVFNRIWRAPEFTIRSFGPHTFTHPRYGQLTFEHTSWVPDGHPEIRVVICAPVSPAARLALQDAASRLAASAE